MTCSTKQKRVVQELNSSPHDRLPDENERIVRVICGRGRDLYEVLEIGKEEETFLVLMPSKFRKTVWIKRDNYLFIKDIPEGSKVKAEISEVLSRKRVDALRKAGVLPESDGKDELSDEEDLVNHNRRNIPVEAISDSTSSEED